VETEHLLKALLEQPNGLARKILSKAEGNPTALLDATEAFIRRQPRVSGDSSQVACASGLLYALCADVMVRPWLVRRSSNAIYHLHLTSRRCEDVR
jgi:ATP-dependent Clp protease ATP-binding subunit ClpA